MSFLLGLPLSSETAVTILAFSGKTPWLKEQFVAVVNFLLEFRNLVLLALKGFHLKFLFNEN